MKTWQELIAEKNRIHNPEYFDNFKKIKDPGIREKKFKCPYGEPVEGGKNMESYTMNCFYFGCIHQIEHDCPIIKEVTENER